MDDEHGATASEEGEAAACQPSAAQRALAEAAARRTSRKRTEGTQPREINGRQGPEPVRYGDWENKGIASDF